MAIKKYAPYLIVGAFLLLGAYRCPIYAFLGIPCPACGITRAYRLFFCANVGEAFLMHPLFWLPAVLIFPFFRKRWALWAIAILFFAVYIVRMVLLFPHTAPMNFNYDSVLGVIFK